MVIVDKGTRLQLEPGVELGSSVYSVLISECLQVGKIKVIIKECTKVPGSSSGQTTCDRIRFQTRRNVEAIALSREDEEQYILEYLDSKNWLPRVYMKQCWMSSEGG